MNDVKCCYCNKPLKRGEEICAFLRTIDHPNGQWTRAVILDQEFFSRIVRNKDNIKRKHLHCEEK